MSATERGAKSEQLPYATFHTVADEAAIEIFHKSNILDDDKTEPLIEKFTAYCSLKNITYECHVFNSKTEGHETFDQFFIDLRIWPN